MNIVCFGAHPDDVEFYAGGTVLQWVDAGFRVLAVSLTNGDIGHMEQSGGALAQRRRAETDAAAQLGGYESLVLDHHDGELQPTLDLRREIVRITRRHNADLVLTHRPWDYHPDHRYAAQAVQDAAFMVTVPFFCPDVPALRQNPVFMYMMDAFQKPVPFRADVAVDTGTVMARKWALLDAMPSQVYEWLPWLEHKRESVPVDPSQRRQWLEQHWDPWFRAVAPRAQAALSAGYGPAHAQEAEYVEMFEVCEYGRRPGAAELGALFPFVPRFGSEDVLEV